MTGSAADHMISGDVVEWLRSLPADQRSEFDMVEGIAVVVQVGATNLYQVGEGHVDVHTHGTADEAASCYAAMVDKYQALTAPNSPLRALVAAMTSGQAEPFPNGMYL